jgi:dTDP-4-amino-4,6-dideoxygalactose transaminase
VVLALGAVPVTVPVEPATATMSAAAAAERAGPRTAAAVVCHPLGIPADVAAVRDAIAGVPVVEDCAQALGSTIDGTPVGCLGDLAVFSFGPGKPVDTGEGGMVLARDWDVWEAAARQAAHPVRQLTGGAGQPCLTGLPCRPHPLAAVLLACALQDWEPGERRRRHRLAAESIAAGSPGVEVLGLDGRRRNASLALPVRLSRTDGRCRPACVDAGLFHIDDLLRGAETRPSGIGLVAPQTRTGRGGAR